MSASLEQSAVNPRRLFSCGRIDGGKEPAVELKHISKAQICPGNGLEKSLILRRRVNGLGGSERLANYLIERSAAIPQGFVRKNVEKCLRRPNLGTDVFGRFGGEGGQILRALTLATTGE